MERVTQSSMQIIAYTTSSLIFSWCCGKLFILILCQLAQTQYDFFAATLTKNPKKGGTVNRSLLIIDQVLHDLRHCQSNSVLYGYLHIVRMNNCMIPNGGIAPHAMTQLALALKCSIDVLAINTSVLVSKVSF